MRTAGADIVYDYLNPNKGVQAEHAVNFDKQLPRYSKKRKMNAMSTPFYNPNYEIIQKRLNAGVPLFNKQSARKDPGLQKNCLNEYDINDIERSSAIGNKVLSPRFDLMFGRDTLTRRFH